MNDRDLEDILGAWPNPRSLGVKPEPVKQSSIIKQITAIIEKGGPKEVKYDHAHDLTFLSDKEIPELKVYYDPTGIEDECEQFNNEYIAKAILKCLRDYPLDFKSVHDRNMWQTIIEKMIND